MYKKDSDTYDIYLLPPGEDVETCTSWLRMRNRDGRYNLMFEEWVTDGPFIISPRITFEVRSNRHRHCRCFTTAFHMSHVACLICPQVVPTSHLHAQLPHFLTLSAGQCPHPGGVDGAWLRDRHNAEADKLGVLGRAAHHQAGRY